MLNIMMLLVIVIKGWILFTVIIGGYLAVILFSSIFIDYYYGREEKDIIFPLARPLLDCYHSSYSSFISVK